MDSLPRFAFGAMTFLLAATALAQGTQVYRYTEPDGRVVYSDRPPGTAAKNVQTKRVGSNFIENNELPYAAQQASERFPVTLYTFECGEVCQNAETLLNKRGVPFSTVNVQDPQGLTRVQALTGDTQAPVLAVGDKTAKGFNEARWQALLDEAGYPKAPAPRRSPPVGRVTDASPPPTSTAAAEATRSATPPARGTDYPKQ